MSYEVNEQDMANFAPPVTVDLSDLATAGGGAWEPGWYVGEVIEGYTAGKNNYQFNTEDVVSQKGDSRNLRVCFRLKRGEFDRTIFTSYNYRPDDFTAKRIEAVKTARKEMGSGKWVGYEDLQRSSLALGKLGQLQKALGETFSFHPEIGSILPGPIVGKTIRVRLIVNEDGYNDVAEVSTLKK